MINILSAAHEKSLDNTTKAFKEANMLSAEVSILSSSSGGEAGAAAASSAKDDSDKLISKIVSKSEKNGFDLSLKRPRFNTPCSEVSSVAASISLDSDDDMAIEIAIEREKLKDREAEREHMLKIAEADRPERIDRELRDRAERQAEREAERAEKEAERAERRAERNQQINFQNRMLELLLKAQTNANL